MQINEAKALKVKQWEHYTHRQHYSLTANPRDCLLTSAFHTHIISRMLWSIVFLPLIKTETPETRFSQSQAFISNRQVFALLQHLHLCSHYKIYVLTNWSASGLPLSRTHRTACDTWPPDQQLHNKQPLTFPATPQQRKPYRYSRFLYSFQPKWGNCQTTGCIDMTIQ